MAIPKLDYKASDSTNAISDLSDELPAGRELDALVAVSIMQTHTVWDKQDGTPEQQTWGKLVDASNGALRSYDDLPEYSTDITAADTIIDAMRICSPYPFWFEMRMVSTGWVCNFVGDVRHNALGLTRPLAICRAALKAVAHG